MEKELADLKEKMINLMNGYRDGSITDDNSTPYINDIILAGAEVYKNEQINLYAPLNHGEAMAYETDGEYFIPLFTSMENHEGIEEYRPVSLKEVCSYVYDNQMNYELLDDPEYCLNHGISYPELMEYAKKNPKYGRIVLDPGTKYPFGFEGWTLKALIFKGMGVDRVHAVDGETGETVHEI